MNTDSFPCRAIAMLNYCKPYKPLPQQLSALIFYLLNLAFMIQHWLKEWQLMVRWF
ncbi:hypothetical protein [Dolichospermum compactum]|uniref:hypothetical protein n=1 Tax=Dolichospermum compactum TaxID=136073 RepID=UPI0018D54702|nr:hypothetical protein [Dolichospermum compactum]